MTTKKIKVLIVDDSAFVRQSLTKIINSSSEMEVIATAVDPYAAVEKIKKEKPDVITLDIQMPKMDGLTFLKKIMNQHPIPVVIVSSIAQKDSEVAIEAFRLGATAVIEKPHLGNEIQHSDWNNSLVEAISAAVHSRVSKLRFLKTVPSAKPETSKQEFNTDDNIKGVILIGSSAGGTEVIFSILSQLSANTYPILIVQHMPPLFTTRYAQRLDLHSKLKVKEANSGDELKNACVYLAPGDQHMELKNNGRNYFVKTNYHEKVNRHRPSVDVLFESALKYKGLKKMAIILSGMGNDGSEGMRKLKMQNAITIAQNEESSIVYGMPKEALISGAADYSLSINEIVSKIISFSKLNR